MVIITEQLFPRFKSLLETSCALDLAVSWVTKGAVVDEIVKFAKRWPVKVLTGISVVRSIHRDLEILSQEDNIQVRIALPERHSFNMRLYVFHQQDEPVCWIGSPKLTDDSFLRSVEVVYEFVDSDSQGRSLFNSLWLTYPEGVDKLKHQLNMRYP